MSHLLKFAFIAICAFSLFFASWYVINGDIVFSADIGRDFHLFREIDEKKLILIGPRSSSGLFHGPVWLYLNYPAYLIGQGNPIVVGWFWVLLATAFVIGNFFIAKKLFGKLTAYFFAATTAVYLGYHTMGLFNPHGAMFLIPLFFYLFIIYLRTKKLSVLLFHLIVGGLILQFQLALGVPLLLLSVAYLLFFIIKSGKKSQLFAFAILPILVSNFILFDLRHNFLYLSKMMEFITPQQKGEVFNYLSLVPDRLTATFMQVEILRHDPYLYLNLTFFLAMITLMIVLIRQNKHKDVYLSFLYFYFGFFLLSFINKGVILYFYIFPLFPLTFLMLASFLDTKYKNYVIVPLIIILLINILNAVNDINSSTQRIGREPHSWKFLKSATDVIFNGSDNEFGYFVFSPDAVAYEGRYAMMYAAQTHEKKSSYFTKKPITYLFIGPTPRNKYVTGDAWWTKERVKIDKKPIKTIPFPNGYKIEKYQLTAEELQIPFDPSIDLGIHFR